MPIYDFRCTACEAPFEQLVRSSTVPTCPQCASTAVERCVSRTSPPGQSQALIAAGRRAAAAEGHFSHYSRAEKARIK
jgi:putative FmdB family regulatory protein